MRDTPETQAMRLGSDLAPMRQLWLGIERDLANLGVSRLADLRGRAPEQLCRAYCARSGQQPDDVLLDVFTALVAFTETRKPQPWWRFTRQRAAAAYRRPVCRVDMRRTGTDDL